jgi:hypothetical protein
MSPDEVLALVDRLRLAYRGDANIEVACNELMKRVLAARPTLTSTRPWAAEGVSRATWYRRRA